MVKPPFTEVRYMTRAVFVPVPGYLKKCELEGEPSIHQYGDGRAGMVKSVELGTPTYTLTVEVIVMKDQFLELERLQKHLKFSSDEGEKIPTVVILEDGNQLAFIGERVLESAIIGDEQVFSGELEDKGTDSDGFPVRREKTVRKVEFRLKLESKEPIRLLPERDR